MRILAVNVFKGVKLAWLQYREFNRVLAELESYTDRELIGDLRIDRADIVRVAHEAAEQHVAEHQAERQQVAARRPQGYAALFNQVGGYNPFHPQPRYS